MKEEGHWVTLKSGLKVFIKDGQTLMDALVRQYGKKNKETKLMEEEKKNIVKQINDLSKTELLPKNNKNYFNLQLKDANNEVLRNVVRTLEEDYMRPYEEKYTTNVTKKTYNQLVKVQKAIYEYLGRE